MAQLVVASAELNHSGQYRWNLRGGQQNVKLTILNVSEPRDAVSQETVLTATPETVQNATPETVSPRPAEEAVAHTAAILALVAVFLCLLILVIFAWYKRRRPLKYSAFSIRNPTKAGGKNAVLACLLSCAEFWRLVFIWSRDQVQAWSTR